MATFRVFICATLADLVQERRQVIDALRRMHIGYISMESFGADDAPPIEVCLERVRACDALLVIVGHSYGCIVPNRNISFSQAEYEEGLRLNKPCLVYLLHENAIIPEKQDREPAKREQLARWKSTLNERHTVARFGNSHELAMLAVSDLRKRFASRILEPLRRLYDEEWLAVALTILFGAAYWEVNHLLHWLFGLTYEQVLAQPGSTGLGETSFDRYMGVAFLALTAIGVLIPFRKLRGHTYRLSALLIGVPTAVTLLLCGWRDRGSVTAVVFCIMHGLVLALLLQLCVIRKGLIDRDASVFQHPHVTDVQLQEWAEKVASASTAAIVAAVLVVFAVSLMVATTYLAPDAALAWTTSPAERQLLATLYGLAALLIFCEATLIVWPRCMTLKGILSQRKSESLL
jgi:hypothetical protein